MTEIFLWLLTFFLILALLCLLGYQLILLVDLEFDYINPYDSASRINWVVLPEFIVQGVLCFILLVTGNWLMFLLSLPYLYYNVTLYMTRQHLVDVTEIYNQLKWEKKKRFIKVGYLILLFLVSVFWLVWSIADVDD
ncbi:protein cornichon homolog 4-like [Prosopis cineraria]|uniref:protein cornichon homolog 4-like n=1 Tax=Prosopis cineraria TaxID=364024 RepID=UPI00240EC52C|nr:protein cornichon homolog 4-like [Prosopis cineraria]XP_054781474.1 protein cornichon homolog 4-like [Prosopis cineraria]XP_054781475.1 protein cornichon homolog 4-like [Prosopis cineraria]